MLLDEKSEYHRRSHFILTLTSCWHQRKTQGNNKVTRIPSLELGVINTQSESGAPAHCKNSSQLDYPIPQTRHLGMGGYHCGFCRHFADVVSPHTSLAPPTKTFVQHHLHAKTLLSLPKLLSAAHLSLRLWTLHIPSSQWQMLVPVVPALCQ